MLLIAWVMSFSFVATSCGDDDDDEVVNKKADVPEYTIFYDVNGGTGTYDPTTFRIGERILLPDGAHLHTIKGANWAKVTVESIQVRK